MGKKTVTTARKIEELLYDHPEQEFTCDDIMELTGATFDFTKKVLQALVESNKITVGDNWFFQSITNVPVANTRFKKISSLRERLTEKNLYKIAY